MNTVLSDTMDKRRHIFGYLVIYVLILAGCSNEEKIDNILPISSKSLYDTASIYYAEFDKYPTDLSTLPIGVIDASSEGFSVVEDLLVADYVDNITGALSPDGIPDFGGENFQFLADEANSPYRNYIQNGNVAFLKEQVVRNSLFMMGSSFYNLTVDDFRNGVKERVKAIVLFSNLSVMNGMAEVKDLISRSGVDIIVVGAIEAALRNTFEGCSKSDNYCVGVLASSNGVTAREYEETIRRMAQEREMSGSIQVFFQEGTGIKEAMDGVKEYISPDSYVARKDYRGPGLGISYKDIDISLMDRYNFNTEGNNLLRRINLGGEISDIQLNSVENYLRYHIVSIVERHRRSGNKVPLSAIVLADYRYADYKDVLNQIIEELYNFKRDGGFLYRESISPEFRFIDPVEEAAKECYLSLRKNHALALRGTGSKLSAFISVFPLDRQLDNKYLREPGSETVTYKEVPFASRYVDPAVISNMEKRLPVTYSLLKNTLY